MAARIGAVLLALIGAFLVFAVIAAFASDGGVRVGVVILYLAIAAGAAFGAVKLWTRGGAARTA